MSCVLCAMSGGVDSAVAAALLQQHGHTVAGATMLLHDAGEAELEGARASAAQLGIDFYVFDFRDQFRALVQTPFARVYQSGGTPNPCVICNKTVKFGLFLDKALELGFDKIATGHYARIAYDEQSGRYLVRTALDAAKDQTYMFLRSHSGSCRIYCCRWGKQQRPMRARWPASFHFVWRKSRTVRISALYRMATIWHF